MSTESVAILVVDDEPDLRELYELTLMRAGYKVHTAASVATAKEALAAQVFGAVISDMRLSDGLGLEVLAELQRLGRPERAIVITAYGSAENAVEALKAGAFDYISKPVDLKQLREVVAAAVAEQAQRPAVLEPKAKSAAAKSKSSKAKAEPAAEAPPEAVCDAPEALRRIVGCSAAMQTVRENIAKAARGMAPILVHGESGTGKELVAQAVHACSQRADGPFVAVNCGAIPEGLLEAEFFGARKGSYTGATADRQGFFQAAHGGTLFLDEIGDLPLAMQAKLLRVIQARKVRPLGATQEEPVDVRIVSATHHDLAAAVQGKRFRQDLYYRLNVIELLLPPLRERREDIPGIAEVLLRKIADFSGLAWRPLSAAAQAALLQHPLTGNVRELENILQRALAMSEGEELALDAPEMGAQASGFGTTGPGQDDELPYDMPAYLDAVERGLIARALQLMGQDAVAAADRLGVSPRELRSRMQQLGLGDA